MADLVISNMPEMLLLRLERRAGEKQRSVAEELLAILEAALEEEETLSITDLRGLGKELWEGRSVREYIEEERRSWDPKA